MLSDSALLGLPAPAKLNLFLHVVGRRPDGKHLLESVFTLIDLHDTIDLFRLEEPVVERTGDVIGNVEKDLCVRAARLLMETFDVRSGVRIHVEKRIPAGAGMGGGSSDAATVLIGLNRLFGLGLSRCALMELGERLGADVPFFISAERASWRALERSSPRWKSPLPHTPSSGPEGAFPRPRFLLRQT